MKKIKLILITLLILLFDTINVNAMTLKPNGPNVGKRGSEITTYITLNRTSDEKNISAVDGKFSYDSNILTLTKAESLMGSNWSEFSPVTNNGTFSYANISFNNLINETSKDIVKVIFKINDNAPSGNTIIGINSPSATDEEGNGVAISGGNHTVKILSDVNTLTDLAVTGATLNFNENTTNYNLEINEEKITIIATKKDSTSTMSGATGEQNLKYGLNVFGLTVTSESGLKKTYVLNITRPDNRNKINNLSKLEISEGKIKFNKDITTYNVTVENNITKIDIKAELSDSKSTFVSGFGNRTVDLKEGNNVIEIKVKAENESIKTYTINITRKSDKSSNNYLKNLKLNHGNIEFDKETLEYKISVENDVENIEIEATPEDSKAIVEIIDNKELKVGENTIIIKVTAEDKNTREYKIIVKRKSKDEILSGNSKLTVLTIDGYHINFNAGVYNYDLTIKEDSSLIINYTKEDPNSTVVINGNNNLKDGSTIEIIVTAEDGSKTTYNLNISKENKNNLLLIIIISTILLLIIISIITILLKNKKNHINNNISSDSIQNNNVIHETNENMVNNLGMNELPIITPPIYNSVPTSTMENNNLNTAKQFENPYYNNVNMNIQNNQTTTNVNTEVIQTNSKGNI